jgi:hypothetical protein
LLRGTLLVIVSALWASTPSVFPVPCPALTLNIPPRSRPWPEPMRPPPQPTNVSPEIRLDDLETRIAQVDAAVSEAARRGRINMEIAGDHE